MEFLKGKRGVLDIMMRWPEYLFIVLFFVGFFMSVLAVSPALVYTFVVIIGLGCGRYFFLKRLRTTTPFVIVVSGLFLGYWLGVIVSDKGNSMLVLMLFVGANFLSYALHERGFFVD